MPSLLIHKPATFGLASWDWGTPSIPAAELEFSLAAGLVI